MGFIRSLIRRKQVSDDDLEKTDLARCLTTFDLTALGVGSTLGAGAYVIAGQVAKKDAGPAVIISFFIAAVASVLAGLCYAEFGARVPKTGSAYVYTYVSVGELVAFIIGWNLILEYVIGAASVARTFSGYFDDLVGDVIIPWMEDAMGIHISTLAPYFDIFALAITLLITLVLAFGVKESATFTNIFTGLNMLVLSYIIISGAFKDDPQNWNVPESQVPAGNGHGGFAPYGIQGIMSGAATCFFAFVGFDAIATTGEEVKNPQKAIPIAIIISLAIIFTMYLGISVTITMMLPYYELNEQAPFAKVFEHFGWTISKYIIGIGAICALSTSLLGAMFPMPRVVLAMARDGLIFRFLANVSERFQTPVLATILSGSLAGMMAALFDVDALVDMMSIGTLLAYTLVSACVMLLRYETNYSPDDYMCLCDNCQYVRYDVSSEDLVMLKTVTNGYDHLNIGNTVSKWSVLLRPKRFSQCPTPFSARMVKILTIVLSVFLIAVASLLNFASSYVFSSGGLWAKILLAFSLIGAVVCIVLITIQPQSLKKLHFTVPFVPFFPITSMFFNIYLMLNLDPFTWVRFAVWMLLGFVVYFGYGIRHSSEAESYKVQHGTAMQAEFGAGVSQAQLYSSGSESTINTLDSPDNGYVTEEPNGVPKRSEDFKFE